MDKKQCIYCFASEKSRKDWNGEHVIPKLLGGPDSYQLYREVCPVCNSRFGETIENLFREKTPEGYLACMYQLGRGSGYMTCGRDFDVQVSTEYGELSPDIFFHIDLLTEELKIPPQITFRSGSKRYSTFEQLSPKKLREKLKWFRSKTVDAVAYGLPGIDPFEAGRAAGLQVAHVESGKIIPAGTSLGQVTFKFKSKRDRTIMRLAAKIAFNYLAFCGMPAFDSVLLSRQFDSLRKFTCLPDDIFDKQFGERTLVDHEDRAIFYSGEELRKGRPFHRLKLTAENVFVDAAMGLEPGFYPTVVCRVNFFSLGDYVVRMGFWPFVSMDSSSFGCEHLLDLKTKQLIRLKKNSFPDEQNDFRLFSA